MTVCSCVPACACRISQGKHWHWLRIDRDGPAIASRRSAAGGRGLCAARQNGTSYEASGFGCLMPIYGLGRAVKQPTKAKADQARVLGA